MKNLNKKNDLSPTNIINSQPALEYIFDNQAEAILWCNKAFEKITGYTLTEAQVMGIEFFRTIMHQDDFLLAKKVQQRFVENEIDSFFGFCRIHSKNRGTWVWLYCSAIPYSYTEDSELKNIICISQVFDLALNTPHQAKLAFHAFFRQYNQSTLSSLTSREKEILKLLGEGNKAPVIAKKLFLSYETVKKVTAHLREKFNVHTSLSLATVANELGL